MRPSIILGVDPGSNYIGIALLTLNIKLSLINLKTFTIDLTNPTYAITNNNLNYRLRRLYEIIYEICIDYNPFWLAIEAGFINRFRPAAYGPIAKSIYAIEDAFIDYLQIPNITEYPPSIVKRKIARQGLATKQGMLEAVMAIPELSQYLRGDETEHEIDALAIGYTRLLEFREEIEKTIPR